MAARKKVAEEIPEESIVMEEVNEEVSEETMTPQVAKEEIEGELIKEIEIKCHIHVPAVIPHIYGAEVVEVENAGFGDVFVSKDEVSYSSENLLVMGDTKVFTDAEALVAISASMPVIKVRYFR